MVSQDVRKWLEKLATSGWGGASAWTSGRQSDPTPAPRATPSRPAAPAKPPTPTQKMPNPLSWQGFSTAAGGLGNYLWPKLPGALKGTLGAASTGIGRVGQGAGALMGGGDVNSKGPNEPLSFADYLHANSKGFADSTWDDTKASWKDVFSLPGDKSVPQGGYRVKARQAKADQMAREGNVSGAALTNVAGNVGETAVNLAGGMKGLGMTNPAGGALAQTVGWPAGGKAIADFQDEKGQFMLDNINRNVQQKLMQTGDPEVQKEIADARSHIESHVLANVPPGPERDRQFNRLMGEASLNIQKDYEARQQQMTNQKPNLAVSPTGAPMSNDVPGDHPLASGLGLASGALAPGKQTPQSGTASSPEPALPEGGAAPTGGGPPSSGGADNQSWGGAWDALTGGDVGGAWNQTPTYGKVGLGAAGGLILLMLLRKLFGKRASLNEYTQSEIQQANETMDRMTKSALLAPAVKVAPRYSRKGRGIAPERKFVPGHRFQGSSRKSLNPKPNAVRETGADQKIDSMMGKSAKIDLGRKPGPLEASYLADLAGIDSQLEANRQVLRSGETGLFPFAANLNTKVLPVARRSAANQANNAATRWLSDIGIGGDFNWGDALAAAGGGEDIRNKARQWYESSGMKGMEDKVDDPAGETTQRETPWHKMQQGAMVDADKDIAFHRWMRKNRPYHYWLNPFDKSGPFNELIDRGMRRSIAGGARPESTAGRFGMFMVPGLSMLTGTDAAKNKLRRSALKNNLMDAGEGTKVTKEERQQAVDRKKKETDGRKGRDADGDGKTNEKASAFATKLAMKPLMAVRVRQQQFIIPKKKKPTRMPSVKAQDNQTASTTDMAKSKDRKGNFVVKQSMNPVWQDALLGAGVGAGIGGLSSIPGLFHSDPQKKSDPWKRMAVGAALGGAGLPALNYGATRLGEHVAGRMSSSPSEKVTVNMPYHSVPEWLSILWEGRHKPMRTKRPYTVTSQPIGMLGSLQDSIAASGGIGESNMSLRPGWSRPNDGTNSLQYTHPYPSDKVPFDTGSAEFKKLFPSGVPGYDPFSDFTPEQMDYLDKYPEYWRVYHSLYDAYNRERKRGPWVDR